VHHGAYVKNANAAITQLKAARQNKDMTLIVALDEQYQNRKEEFFEVVWNVWNWDDIARRYDAARSLDLHLSKSATPQSGNCLASIRETAAPSLAQRVLRPAFNDEPIEETKR
jgi:hypothetical protein